MNRKSEKSKNVDLKKFELKKPKRVCNICKGAYKDDSRFSRFCPYCKETSELLHFHEWMTA